MAKPTLKINMARKTGDNAALVALLSDGELRRIPHNKIDRDPNQPRPMAEVLDGIEDFAAELKRDGIIQPPVFNLIEDRYQILWGERRTEANKINGNSDILGIVKRFSEHEKKKIFELQYAENDEKNRKSLSPMAEAKWWENYINVYHNGSAASAAMDRGISKGVVSNKLKLLDANDRLIQCVQKNNIKDFTLIADLVRIGSKDSKLLDDWVDSLNAGTLSNNLRHSVKELRKHLDTSTITPERTNAPPAKPTTTSPQEPPSTESTETSLSFCTHPDTQQPTLIIYKNNKIECFFDISNDIERLKSELEILTNHLGNK
ncbi:MAG: ParB/RepB/Spo0J family partition protein [Gammaproteobacteria bacterium]|nr:ParB/RepB/Spo0J family partition protein [Gammaproteobacteria bacterium]